MIVHDPRGFLVTSTTPAGLQSCGGSSLVLVLNQVAVLCETLRDLDEPRVAADALGRQARHSAESHVHACPPLPARPCLTSVQAQLHGQPHPHPDQHPALPSAESQGAVRLFRRMLTSVLLPQHPHPGPLLANQSRAFVPISKESTSRRHQIALSV